MSRHRDIRNLNIHDELEDDALSDGGEEELSSEQEAAMIDGLEQVRQVIGGEDHSGISDKSIKDVLWDSYFDVEKTLQWAVEEQQRRNAAKERKDSWEDRTTTLEQDADAEHYQYYSHENPQYQDDENVEDYHDTNSGPRLPSIFLAQQQPGFDNDAYLAVESPRPLKKFLSTISERTERTEPSMLQRSRQQHLVPNSPSMSSPTTSYGHELDDRMSLNSRDDRRPLDPNTSRNSPSLSAIEMMAKFEPPPSNSSSSTITPVNHPYTTSDPVSSFDNIPTIPDLESKTSHRNHKDLPITPTPTLPNKSQSKLSKLASSRASSIASISSRSTGTAVTGSIKTFPNLRPSAQSERPTSIASSKDLPPLPPISAPSYRSSTSSLVHKAIEAALQLEGLDKDNSPKLEAPRSPSVVYEETDRSKTPTPRDVHPVAELKEPVKTVATSPTRPLSKLAKLAQQKAESTVASNASSRSPVDLPSPSQSMDTRESRPLSKLARLAQQKVDSSRVPQLPKTTTAYLTPIANGPSVTTAITTSYQSLYSLTDPKKSNYIPKLNVVPLQTSSASPVLGSSPKTSKLAMKIKRAGEKPVSPGFPSEEEIVTPPLSPLFLPNNSTSARALPSAFASVLISDLDSSPKDKGKDKDVRRKKKEHGHRREKEKAAAESSSIDSHPHRMRKHKHSSKAHGDDSTPPPPFSFDGPSPDDIVLNARKGTAIGKTPSSATPNSSARVSAISGNSRPTN